jgi:hypothetical protein
MLPRPPLVSLAFIRNCKDALFQCAAFLNGQMWVQRSDELAELFLSLGGKHQRFRIGQAFELLRKHWMLSK